jgi:hypothetical protein
MIYTNANALAGKGARHRRIERPFEVRSRRAKLSQQTERCAEQPVRGRCGRRIRHIFGNGLEPARECESGWKIAQTQLENAQTGKGPATDTRHD